MKIIRWFFSHSLLILVIVAVIYAYMYWGNLLGKDTPAGKAVAYLSEEFQDVEEFVNAVKTKQSQLSDAKSSRQATENTNSETSDEVITGYTQQSGLAETGHRPDNTALEEHQVAQQSLHSSVPPASVTQRQSVPVPAAASWQQLYEDKRQRDSDVVAQNSGGSHSKDWPRPEAWPPSGQRGQAEKQHQQMFDPGIPQNNRAAGIPQQVESMRPADSFVPEDISEQMDNINARGEVINPSQPGGAVRDAWISARKAFYQRDYNQSEQDYKTVIHSTKDNFDAYGELGNVYFNQGKDKEAAAAYFEAAAILIKKGQVNRARSLMGLLRHLDREKASELQRLIDTAKS